MNFDASEDARYLTDLSRSRRPIKSECGEFFVRDVLRIDQPVVEDCGVPVRGVVGRAAVAVETPGQLELREDRLQVLERKRRGLPDEIIRREVADAGRIDPAISEGGDEGDAIVARVMGDEVAIPGDERAQIVAEGDVDRRTIVERPDAYAQNLARDLAGFVRHATREIGGNVALRQDAGPIRGQTGQVAYS